MEVHVGGGHVDVVRRTPLPDDVTGGVHLHDDVIDDGRLGGPPPRRKVHALGGVSGTIACDLLDPEIVPVGKQLEIVDVEGNGTAADRCLE